MDCGTWKRTSTAGLRIFARVAARRDGPACMGRTSDGSVPRAGRSVRRRRWASAVDASDPGCRAAVGGVRAGRLVVFRRCSRAAADRRVRNGLGPASGTGARRGAHLDGRASSRPNTRVSVCSARSSRGRSSVHGAQSAFLTPARGAGWIAIGDAAWSSDPLAGIGVSEALQSARSAARAVDAACSGDDGMLSAYGEALNERVTAVLAQLLRAYREELRWADRPFWRRRHAVPARIAPITILPDALVRFCRRRRCGNAQPWESILRHVATLLTLAPTPRPAASVIEEFTARCPIGATTALRALQALADVVA